MHVIDRTDAFTLVGADARRGKLTLFAAEGPRERGALEHVALRVRDLERGARRAAGRTRDRAAARGRGVLRARRGRRARARRGRRRISTTTSTTSRSAPPIRGATAAEYELARLPACGARRVRVPAGRGRRRLDRVPAGRAGRAGAAAAQPPRRPRRLGRRARAPRRATSASRSTTSSTRRTRSRSSSAAPSACGSSTSSTSRRSP